ncbi:hypothetical protein I7I48_10689 [Histoplasma ohiense]|nr:hypothetical protein I7I48_10689 [Histoplasma ohiense (nom. inval.)]
MFGSLSGDQTTSSPEKCLTPVSALTITLHLLFTVATKYSVFWILDREAHGCGKIAPKRIPNSHFPQNSAVISTRLKSKKAFSNCCWAGPVADLRFSTLTFRDGPPRRPSSGLRVFTHSRPQPDMTVTTGWRFQNFLPRNRDDANHIPT